MPKRSLPSLSDLQSLDAASLRDLWHHMFGAAAPPHAKRDLLTRCLAYALQERAQGSLSKPALKQLRGCADGEAQGAAAPSLRPGARLVRSWGGGTHEVTVIERGFAYRGTTYRSLSEIAQQITGAHWSGPRFFGIRSTEKHTRRTA
jgi:hypothetical protein